MPIHPHEHPTLVRIANLGRTSVPGDPDPDAAPRPPRRLEVFGTGTDWVQLTWSRLGPGPFRVRCGDHESEILGDGGPGAHLISDLRPETVHTIELRGPALAGNARTLSATTLPRPPGEELLRVATVSDVHLGSHATGMLHTIAEIPTPTVPHTVRCLRAAQTEAGFWGAQHLLVKGDLVDVSRADNWALAADVLGAVSMPVEVLAGNHEWSKDGDVDPREGAAAAGLDLVDGMRTIDRDGVRIILADTTRPGSDLGQIRRASDIVEHAAAVDGPVLVALHHQITRHLVPTYIPVGVPRPSGRRFLRELGRANARTIVTSGHTHRHRRYEVGPVTVTEVGSTKDFPGTWAGYQIHEGGIVQTVRRIAEPSVIRWTDHSRRAALGVWGHWAPGPSTSRCFTRRW